MTTLREWWHRACDTVRRRRSDRDLEDELRSHLELAADALQQRGEPSADVPRAVRLRAGGSLQALEAVRDQRGLPWVEDVGRDVRYGLRALWRTPLFTVATLATLALGIGVNATIFTVVNGVLLQPLAHPHADRLLYVRAEGQALGISDGALSASEYLELKELVQTFSLGAYSTGSVGYTTGEVNLTTNDRPLRARALSVDKALLDVLGVVPARGRAFSAQESVLGLGPLPPPVAIVSHELWQRSYGGEPLIGRTVGIDGRPHEIIGVMPPGFNVLDHDTEIWLPLGMPAGVRQNRGLHTLHVIGRLNDGVTRRAAQEDLATALANWDERLGTTGHRPTVQITEASDHGVALQPLHEAAVGSADRAIWALQVAAVFVLLIACANVATLSLARADARRREYAMRAALGASRGRLFRQALTEGLLIAAAGGLAGLWIADAGVAALLQLHPGGIPRLQHARLDTPVVVFVVALSVVSGLVVALASVIHVRTTALVAAVRESGQRVVGGGQRSAFRFALASLEMALAVVLLIGAGLLLQTVYNLRATDIGFDRTRLVTFSLTLPQAITEPDSRVRDYQRLLDRLRQEPAIEAATAMGGLPLQRLPQRIRTRIEAPTQPGGIVVASIDHYQLVMSQYFETMGITIVAGRGFGPQDTATAGRTAVVNEALAAALWPGQNPVGQRLRPNLGASIGAAGSPWTTVIGVARNVTQDRIAQDVGTELYLLADQHVNAFPTMHVVVKTAHDASALSATIDNLVQSLDPAIPVTRLRHMDAVVADAIRQPRLLSQLLATFAGLAVALAIIGTYGVIAFGVAERRKELGIRLALGATRSAVLRMVLAQGLRVSLAGVGIGLAAALAMSSLFASLLFGVPATDPTTFAFVAAVIMLVAVSASWVPAWSASRVDPNCTLRAE